MVSIAVHSRLGDFWYLGMLYVLYMTVITRHASTINLCLTKY